MNRAIITWRGGSKTIEGAKLGDTRVKEELERLKTLGISNIRLEFHDEFDEFDIGRYIDDEEVYD